MLCAADRDELPGPVDILAGRLVYQVPVFEDRAAPQERLGWPPLHGDPLERRVVLSRSTQLSRDDLLEVEVDDGQVSIRSDRDGPLPWVQVEGLRRRGRGHLRDATEGQTTLVDALGYQHRVEQRGAAETRQGRPQILAL